MTTQEPVAILAVMVGGILVVPAVTGFFRLAPTSRLVTVIDTAQADPQVLGAADGTLRPRGSHACG